MIRCRALIGAGASSALERPPSKPAPPPADASPSFCDTRSHERVRHPAQIWPHGLYARPPTKGSQADRMMQARPRSSRASDWNEIIGQPGLPMQKRQLKTLAHLSGHNEHRSGSSKKVCIASFASVWPDHGDFRSTPVNGHSRDRRACLKGAKRRRLKLSDRRRLMHQESRIDVLILRYGRVRMTQLRVPGHGPYNPLREKRRRSHRVSDRW